MGKVCSALVFSKVRCFVQWPCQGSQCGVRAFLGERSFLFLSLSRFPLVWVGLLCHISPPQSVLKTFNPDPYPEDQQCSPHLCAHSPLTVGWCEPVSCFLAGNCCSVRILQWFLLFQSFCSLRFQSSPTDFALERVSYCVETSPSRLPPQDGSPSLNSLSFVTFIFCLTSFWTDWFAFLGICGPLFGSSFVEVVPHADDRLMYLWGSKWSPHPIPLSSWDHPTTFRFSVHLSLVFCMELQCIRISFFYM